MPKKKVNTKKLAVNVDKRRANLSPEALKKKQQNESRVLNAQRRAAERDVTSKVNDRIRWVDWERRDACEKDLALFLKTYFSEMCYNDWSDSQLRSIQRMQYSIEHGGQFAFAMPRGEGKTSISQAGALWGAVYGKRSYIVLIGARSDKAKSLMKDIKVFLRHNRLLKKDFPELLYPIEAIDNQARKAEGQTFNGEPTEITWVAEKLVMPTLIDFEYPDHPDKKVPSCIIEIAGITGDIRGRHHALTNGEIIRPDFVILDDPQTNEAARSPEQVKTRINILNADILGLSGPNTKISAFMPCTIISNNDMAEQILNDPNWHGEVSSMIVQWPEDMDFWRSEYNAARLEGAQSMDEGKGLRRFYKKHKERLEKGAVVSNPYRVRDGELTAIQTAMNLFFEQGERAFYSEYQNQPLSEFANLLELEPAMVRKAANKMKAFEVPINCQFLTAMIDVNPSSGLHYTVLASTNNLEVHCPYYGRYPEDVNTPLWTRESTGGLTEAQAVFNGVVALCNKLNELVFLKGGKQMHIDLIGIDCGYLMDIVFSSCAVADGNLPRTKVVPMRGYAQTKWRESKVVGRPADNVYKSVFDGKGPVVKHNADYWRERVHQAFLLGNGAPGGITLFGEERVHEYFSEHICGERLLEHFQTEKDEYYNWQRIPGRKNDLLDTTVGAMSLFSLLGASFDGELRMDVSKAAAKPQVREATYTDL